MSREEFASPAGAFLRRLLLYPAELVRTIEEARELGVEAEIKQIDFLKIMERMRTLVGNDIDAIRRGLSSSTNIDYYHSVAEFVSPYTMKVEGETINAKMIFLTIGSGVIIPKIKGLEETGYLTSDTLLKLTSLPKSIAIVGGGYIAAEYGHFLSSMGINVTIIGRNSRFLPGEEPEISELAKKEFAKHMQVITNQEVVEAQTTSAGLKRLTSMDKDTGKMTFVEAEEIIDRLRQRTSHRASPPRKWRDKGDQGWVD